MTLKFMGIGAQKAATTWLYAQLQPHPDIYFPEGKEVHFWDNRRKLGLKWYKKKYDRPNKAGGDITPAYAALDAERVKEIYEFQPELKLIFILRDPVERAWSAALMAMKGQGRVYAETPAEWFIDHFNCEPSRLRTNYRRTLDIWLSFFKAEQMLLIDYSLIAHDPVRVLETVQDHIGVRRYIPKNPQKVVHKGSGEELPPELRWELEKLYPDRDMEKIFCDYAICGVKKISRGDLPAGY